MPRLQKPATVDWTDWNDIVKYLKSLFDLYDVLGTDEVDDLIWQARDRAIESGFSNQNWERILTQAMSRSQIQWKLPKQKRRWETHRFFIFRGLMLQEVQWVGEPKRAWRRHTELFQRSPLSIAQVIKSRTDSLGHAMSTVGAYLGKGMTEEDSQRLSAVKNQLRTLYASLSFDFSDLSSIVDTGTLVEEDATISLKYEVNPDGTNVTIYPYDASDTTHEGLVIYDSQIPAYEQILDMYAGANASGVEFMGINIDRIQSSEAWNVWVVRGKTYMRDVIEAAVNALRST